MYNVNFLFFFFLNFYMFLVCHFFCEQRPVPVY